MPELPEVTVIVNQLNNKLKGLILESIEYDWPRKFYWGEFSIKDLKGAKVLGVRRLGKVVIIDLLNDKRLKTKAKKSVSRSTLDISRFSVVIHLKLTGQLIYQDEKARIAGGHPIPPLNLPVPNKTTRVTFAFANHGPTSSRKTGLRGASHLYFNDMRKFGWVKIVESEESKVMSAIGMELGPDPLVMSYGEFRECIARKPQARVKKLLMDQTFISGVGNIYSDEALWRAKIHPKRSVVSLKPLEVRKLYDGIRESLKLAIEKGGSSANTYVDSGGERGLYLSFAKAYHMTGKACSRCKTPIVREKMDGRSAHFCPRCQRIK